MKIKEVLKKTRPVYSFEFFPPKSDEGFTQLYRAIENLKKWNPGYVSVTYGAGGSTRSKTIELVGRIKYKIGLESMAHLTCVGHDKVQVQEILDHLQDKGIENVLALRGDPPKGQSQFIKTKNGFGYANELVDFIKRNYSFCLGVAGYPEGHVESSDMNRDLENLKRKVDAGADFIVTQLFFDNRFYMDFMDRVQALGIKVPVIPGIMPIINKNQTQRFTKMCGASIPDELMARMDSVGEDEEAVKEIGIEHATLQCAELIKFGAPGIHFYTLNRSMATLAILEKLKQSG